MRAVQAPDFVQQPWCANTIPQENGDRYLYVVYRKGELFVKYVLYYKRKSAGDSAADGRP